MHRTKHCYRKIVQETRFLDAIDLRSTSGVLRVKGNFCLVSLALTLSLMCSSVGFAAAAPLLQPVLAVAAQGQIFSRQPKEDPFKQANGSIDRLMQEKKQQAQEHLRQARKGLAQGSIKTARFHHQRAVTLDVKFGGDEDSPEKLLADIEAVEKRSQSAAPNVRAQATPPQAETNSRQTNPSAVRPAANNTENPAVAGKRALYNPQEDTSFNRQATASENDSLFVPPTQTSLPTDTIPPAKRFITAQLISFQMAW